MTDNPRYAGKPLLRLLECWVLRAIGALPADQAKTLEAMTPKLRQIYGAKGDWPAIIAGVVGAAPTLEEKIREMWRDNQEIARRHGIPLAPQRFAEMFVDTNFADAIG